MKNPDIDAYKEDSLAKV